MSAARPSRPRPARWAPGGIEVRLPAVLQRLRRESYDSWFIGAVVALCLLGTIAVYGAGSFTSDNLGQYHYLRQHLQRLLLGSVLALTIMLLDYGRLQHRRLAWSAMLVGLMMTAYPLLQGKSGIVRWIMIPGLGQFQPLEFAKLALVFFLAYRFAAPRLDHPLSFRQLALTLLFGPVILVVILAMQPNFGNIVVMSLVTLLMLFVAGLRWRWLFLSVPAAAGAITLGYLFIPKLTTRIDQWRHGWLGQGLADEPPFGYQVHQSLLGMGAGGWHGLLPGNSHNKFAFLPENHTDFAFSFLGEELGLIGTLVVVSALLVLMWRILIIAERASTRFGRILVLGLGGMLFIYGAANIGMVTGVIPVLGVPLPFISYGGSALVTNLMAVGLILSVDRKSRIQRGRSSVRNTMV
jgi:cell division protein FtsW (lipid II flippase)